MLRAAALLLVSVALLVSLAGCDLSSARSSTPATSAQTQSQCPITGKEDKVPLQVVKGPNDATLALVPVMINGQGPFAFALDTGASQSAVSQQIATQLNLKPTGSTEQVSGVTGTQKVQLVDISQWQAGNVTLPSTQAIAIDFGGSGNQQAGLQGLLGSDVLSQYGAIAVDYESATLYLRARHQ